MGQFTKEAEEMTRDILKALKKTNAPEKVIIELYIETKLNEINLKPNGESEKK